MVIIDCYGAFKVVKWSVTMNIRQNKMEEILEELIESKERAEGLVDLSVQVGDIEMQYLNRGYAMACCEYIERIKEIIEENK